MQMIAFIKAYMDTATQMRAYIIASNWARLAQALSQAGTTLTPQDAADWAALGFLPEEAGQLILDGITAAQYGEMETHAEDCAGGRDDLAAQRIGQMIDSGELVTPE